MRFPRLFNRKIETKESAAAASIVLSPGQARWTPRNYLKLAQESYCKNVIAYHAVRTVADAVADVRWTAWRGEDEVTASPFLDLLAQPNPWQSGREYVGAYVSLHLLSGNGWQERVTVGNTPRELYVLRPDRMKVIEAANGTPGAYLHEGVNGQKVRWDIDPNTGESDVRHDKAFNPINDWYGFSPVEAAAYAIDQHNESMAMLQALLQNSARPSGALKSAGRLADDAYNRLKSEIERQYQGSENAGRPMLLEGVDWQQMSLNPQELQVVAIMESAGREIARAFGVPPLLLGYKGDNTFANYQEARLAFYHDTVIPIANRLAHDWSDWLGPAFGDLVIKPDFDHVEAIVEKKRQLWTMADSSDDLTINERRTLKGYGPISGGDVLMVDMGKVPLDDAGLGSLDADTMKALAYGLERKG